MAAHMYLHVVCHLQSLPYYYLPPQSLPIISSFTSTSAYYGLRAVALPSWKAWQHPRLCWPRLASGSITSTSILPYMYVYIYIHTSNASSCQVQPATYNPCLVITCHLQNLPLADASTGWCIHLLMHPFADASICCLPEKLVLYIYIYTTNNAK